LEITQERRRVQMEHNAAHGITPRSVRRGVQQSLVYAQRQEDPVSVAEAKGDEDVAAVIADLEEEMLEAAGRLQFERAALLRDQIEALKGGNAAAKRMGPRKHSSGNPRYKPTATRSLGKRK
jgi:excinuclease ABC subunit B